MDNEKEIVEKFKRLGTEIPQEFYDCDVVKLLDSDKIFEWGDKTYNFYSVMFEPSITMTSVENPDDKITFSIKSELKDELVRIK